MRSYLLNVLADVQKQLKVFIIMDDCILIVIIYLLFYCIGAILSTSCDEQLDASVNNVVDPPNFDDVSFNQLATVLSTTSMVSPKQSGTNVKRGRGRPRKIKSTIYLP